MKVTIECNSLEELQEAVDTIFIMFPEKSEAYRAKKEEGKSQPIDREKVRKYLEAGYTNKQIAEELGCAYSTIANMARKIKKKRREEVKPCTEKTISTPATSAGQIWIRASAASARAGSRR